MAPSSRNEQLFTGYSGRLLSVLALGSMTGMTARLVLSPLLPSIMEDLAITPFLAGIALSAMWAAGALVQYPSGRAADQLSRKTVVSIAYAALLIGSALLLIATSFLGFVIGVISLGIGAGLATPATFAMLADLYTQRRGQAFSINTAAFNLGGVVAAGLATLILTITVWRFAFIPIIAILLLILTGVHHWSDESYAFSRIDFTVRDTLIRLASTSRIRLMILTTALVEFTWQATASFLPTFLQAEKNVSLLFANNAFAVIFIIGVIANPIAGNLGDRFGFHRISAFTTILATIGLILIIISTSTPLLILGIVVFAIGLTGFWPVMLAAVMAAFPSSSMGGDLGVTRTVYVGIGSFGSAYVGLIAQQMTYTTAFSGLLILLTISIITTSWLAATSPAQTT